MSSTYSALYYHVVVGTHNRVSWIDAKWRPRLHEYLGGTIAGLGGVSCEVGGVADHVHLLVSLRPTQLIPDVVRELKKASNDFVRTEFALTAFAWQDGYGVFTVSPGSIDGVRRYIANQEAHHRTRSFREEWIDMLERAGIEYDPRFLD
jgi:putative transposase